MSEHDLTVRTRPEPEKTIAIVHPDGRAYELVGDQAPKLWAKLKKEGFVRRDSDEGAAIEATPATEGKGADGR